jgi:uncharacterized delta-60 repeat protein
LNADGTLDSTFSGDGLLILPEFDGGSLDFAVALQGDGKIILAGSDVVGGQQDFAVARLNVDGTLDTSFDGGMFTIDFNGGLDQAYAAAVQGDGRIVLAGRATRSALVGGIFGAVRLVLLPDTFPPPAPPPPFPSPPPGSAQSVLLVPLRSRRGKPAKLVLRIPLASGELREIVSPFQKPRFTAIKVTLQDTNGDGFFDSVLITARKGKKKLSRTISL